MRLDDISLLGALHTFLCVLAMGSGTRQLLARKGTPAHAWSGNVYFLAMVAANLTILFVFHGQDLIFPPGQRPAVGYGFGFFHWLAVFALALVLLGRFAASRQRQAFFAYAHPVCMILSYWLLMGGAVNEIFVRVDWVHRVALSVSPNAKTAAGFTLLYVAYAALDTCILAALVIAVLHVRRFRRQPA
jgi:uncharacterized membrane protein